MTKEEVKAAEAAAADEVRQRARALLFSLPPPLRPARALPPCGASLPPAHRATGRTAPRSRSSCFTLVAQDTARARERRAPPSSDFPSLLLTRLVVRPLSFSHIQHPQFDDDDAVEVSSDEDDDGEYCVLSTCSARPPPSLFARSLTPLSPPIP